LHSTTRLSFVEPECNVLNRQICAFKNDWLHIQEEVETINYTETQREIPELNNLHTEREIVDDYITKKEERKGRVVLRRIR